MSGLVSRWATDETLVKEAEVQDKKASKHSSPRKSKQVNNQKAASETPKPLVSRWATGNAEEGKAPQTSPVKNGHKKNNVSNRKRHPNENENTRDVVRKASNKEDEDEKLAPMTNAAKSFAARLGDISINDTGKKTENLPRGLPKGPPPKGPRGQSRKQATRLGFSKSNEDAWEDAKEEEPEIEEVDKDEGPLPPMSKAGQSLASRLGLMNPANSTSKPSSVHASNNKKEPIPKPVQSDSKYLTPRQKKIQLEKENRAKKEREKQERKKILDEEEKEKQQKLKQEVSEMFNKLTDKHANWADIEDDDF